MMSVADQCRERAKTLRETTSETMTASLLERAAREIDHLNSLVDAYKKMASDQ